MNRLADNIRSIASTETLYPERARRLWQAEIVFQVVGVVAAAMQRGLSNVTRVLHWELGTVVILAMIWLTGSMLLRSRWSRVKKSFFRANLASIVIGWLWVLGSLFIFYFDHWLPDWNGEPASRSALFLDWAEICVLLRGVVGVVMGTRALAAGASNPALILIGSFFGLVVLGTLLLMLPKSRADTAPQDESLGQRFRIALFTSTSASCVTGLTVVSTGGSEPYWSRTGQAIILGLFQVGGLGIMTCGAFFALFAGRHVPIRESATMLEILESERLGDVRQLLFSILAFTFASELVGAVLLSGLWSDLSTGDQAFFSIFHAVSAFCNAGFSLTENSFVGMGMRWQVWSVVAGLIIIGGLGFAVLYNVVMALKSRLGRLRSQPLFNLPRTRVRLSITSRLVLMTSAALLFGGAAGYYLLESAGTNGGATQWERLTQAWFQSVTFRTAGFSSVDHGQLQPATKLLAICLMFVGASPGSTGGGVKTICFAVSVLALISIMRGRQRVEIMSRTIPNVLVNRALAIMSLGIMMVMSVTLLLAMFEHRPERFLDHLFEAMSAFATVGVSTTAEVEPGRFISTTRSLSEPSRMVIVAAMFVGRVGPLTVLIALAGRMKEARYDFPAERLTLG